MNPIIFNPSGQFDKDVRRKTFFFLAASKKVFEPIDLSFGTLVCLTTSVPRFG